jgi:hypothetical protein
VLYQQPKDIVKGRNVFGIFNVVKELQVEFAREKTEFDYVTIEEGMV